jgi:hypothetical protein
MSPAPSRILAAMAALSLLAAIPARPDGAGESAPASPEDLFKWGEYDSLIKVLGPFLAESAPGTEATRQDSSERAKTFLYAGVAYYATGKRDQADEAFTRACEFDSRIRIDRYYVTEEIAGHFEGLASALARRRPPRAPEPADAPAGLPAGREDGPGLEERKGNEWVWWTLGSAAVLAGAGASYYLLNRPAGSGEHETVVDAGP